MSHPQHPQARVCMLCAHYDSQRQQAAQGLATNQQLAAQGCLSQQQLAQGQGLSQSEAHQQLAAQGQLTQPPLAQHEHFFRFNQLLDALVCGCGLHVNGEALAAAGFVRKAGNDSRESRLADRCGELLKERNDARARVGELELELRRKERP